jgi:hypothetical protein
MTTVQTTLHPFHIAPENVARGSDRFIPGETIPGNGADEFVDGAETAGAFDGVAGEGFLGKDGLTFADLLDVINPLQHLPVIGDLYRSITGDTISAPARMAGGAIYGGPIGFVSSLVNTVVEEVTGSDVGGNLLALFSPEGAGQTAAAAEGTVIAKAGAKLASAAPQVNLPPLPTLMPPLAATGALAQIPYTGAVSRGVPDLNPAAFQALMTSVNGNAKPLFGPRQGLSAGNELPAVNNGTIREAGLEINRLLRPHSTTQ